MISPSTRDAAGGSGAGSGDRGARPSDAPALPRRRPRRGAAGTRARSFAPLARLLAAALFVCVAGGQAPGAAPFVSAAPYAIVVDHTTETVLLEKNADVPTPPASLAKLMTVAVTFDEIASGQLTLDTTFTVSERAWREGGAPSGGSTMFLPIDAQVSVAELLRGIIVQSGNDACIVIAEGIAGSVEAFVDLMNRKARELGLTGSHFANPHGLPHPDQKVTMRDLARLAGRLIARHPDLYALFAETEYTYNKVQQRNRNRLLGSVPGADGLKTGHTQESGYGIVASALRDGRRITVAITGLTSSRRRDREARKLIELGFRGFEVRTLFDPGEAIATVSVYGGEQGRVPLVAQQAVRVTLAKGSASRLDAKVFYRGPVEAPVADGAAIGTLRIAADGRPLRDVPLYAANAVAPGSLPSRAWDAAADLVLRHLW
jgi:D-alanyl-D-alanine carboxypeptidase (penicillin-binding protein 5/6)